MYRTAKTILDILETKEILKNAFDRYKVRLQSHHGVHYNGLLQDYNLVLTGHSLGAGAASTLALLLKQDSKYSKVHLKCYAFSPPGALFRYHVHWEGKNSLSLLFQLLFG